MTDDRLRIDKWLWFARLAKTRTLAQKLALSGRVRINREKTANAARPVKIGDVLTIALDSGVRVLRIAALAVRRGPAAEARLLYEDLSPPLPARAPAATRTGSRPTKRDRRNIDKYRETLTVSHDDFPSRSERLRK
jgi:ribosome-associated heat shock protein Hsp15